MAGRTSPFLMAATQGTTERPPLSDLDGPSRAFLDACRGLGERGKPAIRTWLGGISSAFVQTQNTCGVLDRFGATQLDAVFEDKIWDVDDPSDLPVPAVELDGHVYITSTQLRAAVEHLQNTLKEGSGGSQVAPNFTAKRTAIRKRFRDLAETEPWISLVDFTNIRYAPLSFANVNMGRYTADALWIAYLHFLADLDLNHHWKLDVQSRRAGTAGRPAGFCVVQKKQFVRLVEAARKPVPQPARRLSSRADSEASESAPLRVLFPINGAAECGHWLKTQITETTVGPDADADVPIECGASSPAYAVARWLRPAAAAIRAPVPLCVSTDAVALLGVRKVPLELIATDAEGRIVARTGLERCEVLGSAFPRPGAVASAALAARHAARTRGSGEAFSVAEHAALKRRRYLEGKGLDADARATAAENAQAVQTGTALPCMTRGAPGSWTGIAFGTTLPVKPGTKPYTDKTARQAPAYNILAHVGGKVICRGNKVGSRFLRALKKRGNPGRNMTTRTKEEIVGKLGENVEVLDTRAARRKYGDVGAELLDAHRALLAFVKRNRGKLGKRRWEAVNVLKRTLQLTDPNADRDQSNTGPRELRRTACLTDLTRAVMAEAAALAGPRPGRAPIKVPPRDDDRIFGYSFARVKRPDELDAFLSRPVVIAVAGMDPVDSSAHPEGSVARRAVGYAAWILETARSVSIQAEILRATETRPVADADDRKERERARNKISIGINTLRTVLKPAMFAVLASKLRFDSDLKF